MLRGKLRLKITCADPVFFINILHSHEILMQDVSYQNDMELGITVNFSDYKLLKKICDKQGVSVKIIGYSGVQFAVKSLWHRPVLLLFLLCVVAASFYLPSRIIFVSVEGNSAVATNKILEAAENCGIIFGASRREVRSEKVKNALLQIMPELQWAGINTSGCTAVISVKEKKLNNTSYNQKPQVSSIVASRDGIVQSCTVYSGNQLCSVGQAVKKGELLVSGYTDCGMITKATMADAEIKALTFHEIQAISPDATLLREQQKTMKSRYSVRIGKKLIKLYKDSGNFDTTCVKIYSEIYVPLPGGFSLPVVVVKETICYYKTDCSQQSKVSDEWIKLFVEKYLNSTMIAGTVLFQDTDVAFVDKGAVLSGRYICTEMIGKMKYEQVLEGD